MVQLRKRPPPEEKITRYLLNPSHPAGGSKAVFFRAGFTVGAWQFLANALFQHARRKRSCGMEVKRTRHGTRYAIDGAGRTSDGTILTRSAWRINTRQRGHRGSLPLTHCPSDEDNQRTRCRSSDQRPSRAWIAARRRGNRGAGARRRGGLRGGVCWARWTCTVALVTLEQGEIGLCKRLMAWPRPDTGGCLTYRASTKQHQAEIFMKKRDIEVLRLRSG